MEEPIYSKGINLIQKLAKIQEIADVAVKNKKGYNYTYADLTQILAKVTAGMKKYGVSLLPLIVPQTTTIEKIDFVKTKVDKTGQQYDQRTTEMLVRADMEFKWVDNDNTEDTIVIPWIVVGSQEDPSQAFGSGLSYCTRYFLTNYFHIAQSDTDVDAYRKMRKEAEDAENVAIAEGIIEQLDIAVKKLLSDDPAKRDDVMKTVTKYVKSGNYKAIKNPELAAKLLAEFKNKFLGEEE